MEATLGKRIAEHRKQLKLTQDQLAEKLGLTAQAVSKWENDQSCPDITMLPKLAEIFGITTDALLGIEPSQKVHEAEVVTNQESDVQFNIDSEKNGKWEFHWDSGRGSAITFAITVLAVGLLTLASRIENWNITFWEILWPCALMAFGINRIIKDFSIFYLSVLLFGGYGLLTNLGFLDFGYDGSLIFPIILVLFGLSLLTDALKKPKHSQYWIKKNGNTVYHNGKQGAPMVHCTTDGEHFECASSFGDYSQAVALDTLSSGEIVCSFGNLIVDLCDCKSLGADCQIEAACSFGQLTLIVPKHFRVVPEANSAFADFIMEGSPDPDAQQLIQLEANVSFGGIIIKYI